ncbi:uncharacterized protein HaLaN_05236, partial [Haematococcus lacustris]
METSPASNLRVVQQLVWTALCEHLKRAEQDEGRINVFELESVSASLREALQEEQALLLEDIAFLTELLDQETDTQMQLQVAPPSTALLKEYSSKLHGVVLREEARVEHEAKALKSSTPSDCMAYFASAVEVDELGCGWKAKFESKLEQIGDFFSLPMKDDRDRYTSMLAEAYLVCLLYTVLSLMARQEGDVEEDYEVVKTRMDECVRLQPKNPMLINDFKQAIDLAEKDVAGKQLNCEGLDPKEQRNYLLAFCHHQLGSLQHRNKELDAAYESYTKAVSYADGDFVNLADCHFSLCILTLLRSKRVETLEKPGVLLQGMRHYKAGILAEKQVLRYLPFVTTDVSRQLAKELLKKFAKERSSS